MNRSVYSLPGYFEVTVLSFWLPTIVFVLVAIFVFRRNPRTKGTWIEKGAWTVIGVTSAMQIAGWVFDVLALHSLSQDLGLAGAIVCGVWAVSASITKQDR